MFSDKRPQLLNTKAKQSVVKHQNPILPEIISEMSKEPVRRQWADDDEDDDREVNSTLMPISNL